MEKKNQDKYKALFRKYYPGLHFYAVRLSGEEEAEDIVQDVFLELWTRPDLVEGDASLQAYLYRMVYTRAINIHKHKKVEDSYYALLEDIHQKRIAYYQPDQTDIIKHIEDRELREEISRSVNALPDKCREIFKLSYIHNMKNKTIADLLGVSVRTVEAHMYKALKLLREKLQHLMILILFLMIN